MSCAFLYAQDNNKQTKNNQNSILKAKKKESIKPSNNLKVKQVISEDQTIKQERNSKKEQNRSSSPFELDVNNNNSVKGNK